MFFLCISKKIKWLVSCCFKLAIALSIGFYSSLTYANNDQSLAIARQGAQVQDMISKLAMEKKAGLQSLDHGLAGDRFDIATGSVTFFRNIVSIPGNSDLPVTLGQVLSDRQGWIDDVPQISTIVPKQFGLPDPYSGVKDPRSIYGEYWGVDRCSAFPNVEPIYLNGSEKTRNQYGNPVWRTVPVPLFPESYSKGVKMITPGGEFHTILIDPSEEFNAPGLPVAHLSTSSLWRISCLDSVTTGTGEGFIAISPTGIKYTFDKLYYKPYLIDSVETSVTTPQLFSFDNSFSQHIKHLSFTEAVVQASKIEDVHGNWVKYEYDGSGYVTRIYSNDGREISVLNRDISGGRRAGATITANGRTWTLSKSKLTLPDQTYWDSSHATGSPSRGLHTDIGKQGYCRYTDWSAWIRHPSGTKITFKFRENTSLYANKYGVRDAKFRKACTDYYNDYHIQHNGTRSFKLVEKSIQLPSNITNTWSYSYEGLPAESGKVVVPDLKWAKEKRPDGSYSKYWINRKLSDKKLYGVVVKVENFGKKEPEPCEVITKTYDGAYIPGLAYHAKSMDANAFFIRYLENIVIKRGQDTYTTVMGYDKDLVSQNFSFGKPTSTTRTSSVSAGSRKETIKYIHKKNKWVIGLVDSYTSNGKLFDKWTYNSLGQPKTYEKFGIPWESYEYHSNGLYTGKLKSIEDAKKLKTIFTDYYRGIPRDITRTDGSKLFFDADADGRVTSKTNGRGFTTTYKYNSSGWLEAIHPPSSLDSTIITYKNLDKGVIETVTQGSQQIITKYDGMYRPVSVERKALTGGGESIYTQTQYDSLGRVKFSSMPSYLPLPNAGVETKYDGLGRISEVLQLTDIDTSVAKTQYKYLKNNTIRVIDPDYFATDTQYEAFGSPSTARPKNILQRQHQTWVKGDKKGTSTNMEYDAWGNIKLARQYGDISGHYVENAHHYFYDSRLRLCRHSVPELGDKLYSYNEMDQVRGYSEGNPVGTLCELPELNLVEYEYDLLHRQEKVKYSDATPDIHRGFDDDGNLEHVKRFSGNTLQSHWHYKYDNTGQLKEENLLVDGLNFKTAYTINRSGHKTHISTPSGMLLSLDPDGFGRPKSIYAVNLSNGKAFIGNLTYHPNNLFKSFSYGNGDSYKQTLNTRQLPESITVSGLPIRSPIDHVSYTYKYNARGKIESIKDTIKDEYSVSYKYDYAGRLNQRTFFKSNLTEKMGYDALGNINYLWAASFTPYQNSLSYFRDTNRLSYANIDDRSYFTHDTRGNIVYNGKSDFVYDLANQPITLTTAGKTNEFIYDGNLKRVKQTTAGESIYSFYTQQAGLIGRYNANTKEHTTYISTGGQTVARETSGRTTFLYNNHLGSPIVATDESGAILWREFYDDYGKTKLNPTANKDNQGFTGHIQDESGLVYMQARYYDPLIGRFLSNDPVGFAPDKPGYFNRYAYAGNDPVNFLDPTGKSYINPTEEDFNTGSFGDDCGCTTLGGALINVVTSLFNSKEEDSSDDRPTVGSEEISTEGTPEEVRDRLEEAGYPGKPNDTKENGTIHTIPGKDGEMDVRVMDGQGNGKKFRGPRIRTTRAGTNDGVYPDGSKLRTDEEKANQKGISHIHF